jgi:hypothetical protein
MTTLAAGAAHRRPREVALAGSQAEARRPQTLFDRATGLIFDNFDHLSWTQNAALSGFNDWASQKVFADSLVFAGFDDFHSGNAQRFGRPLSPAARS